MSELEINIVRGGSSVKVQIPSSMRVLEDEEINKDQFYLFRIINQKDGDKRLAWNRFSIAEINDAKEMFNKLVEQGLVPYRTDEKGGKTNMVMSEFDPAAEDIIFAPIALVVGG